jgi:hypothetical protein
MISDIAPGGRSPHTLPDRLKDQPFVGWKYETVPGRAKPAKVPVNPRTGTRASVVDPESWGDHQTAIKAVDRYGLQGLGIVLTRQAGLTGVDLDDARDPDSGSLDRWANLILDRLAGTYAELSPSGRGVHIFVEGVLPPGSRKRVGDVEAYCDRRFLTVTGAVLLDRPLVITPACDGLSWLASTHLRPTCRRGSSLTSPAYAGPDEELLRRALAHPGTGHRLRALLAGDMFDHPSRSEADYELCRILGFWCGGDPNRVERISRASGAYRLKWDEPRGGSTWLRITVEVALGRLNRVYGSSPPKPPKYCEDKSVSPTPLAKSAQLDRLIDYIRALRRRLGRPVALSVRHAARVAGVSNATAARRLNELVRIGKLIRVRGGFWSTSTSEPGAASEFDLQEFTTPGRTDNHGKSRPDAMRTKSSIPTILPPYSLTPLGLFAVWKWSPRARTWLSYGCCPTLEAARAFVGRCCRLTAMWSVGDELWRYRRRRSLEIIRGSDRHREHTA